MSDTEANLRAVEVEELRAEVARLREQVTTERRRPAPQPGGRTGWWRPVLVTVLVIVIAGPMPLGVVARWRTTRSPTPTVLQSVAPLASDPAVQAAITNPDHERDHHPVAGAGRHRPGDPGAQRPRGLLRPWRPAARRRWHPARERDRESFIHDAVASSSSRRLQDRVGRRRTAAQYSRWSPSTGKGHRVVQVDK